jgi:hypothetical protein
MTPKYIIVHHSITPRDLNIELTQRSINTTHKNRGFPKSSLGFYVGYTYMIFGDGTVRQYRQDNEAGAHCREANMNFQSIGICVIGDFDRDPLPSEAQKTALGRLMREKMSQHSIPVENVYPHRRYAPYKSCYGGKLSNTWARDLILNDYSMKLIAFQKAGEGTVYAPLGGKYIGVASMTALKSLAESVLVKTLTAEEFSGLDIIGKAKIVDN